MTSFKSNDVTLLTSAKNAFSKLSNLNTLKAFIENIPQDKIPADKIEQFRNVTIGDDFITIPGGPTGDVTLKMDECKPHSLIKLRAVGIPVEIFMSLHIGSIDDNKCTARFVIDADIPMLLKPMVSGPLQKIVDQFATVLTSIAL